MPKHLYGKESSGHRAVGIVLESEVEHEAIFRLEHELYPTLARVQYYIILLMLFSGCRGNSDCWSEFRKCTCLNSYVIRREYIIITIHFKIIRQ